MAYFKRCRVACGKLTIAQVNAGYTVVDGEPGRTIRVVDVSLRAIGGAAGAVTSVDITDTADSPVTVATFAQANLTQNTLLGKTSTGITLGAGWNADLTADKGLKIVKNGSDVTTATHFEYTILYARA